MAWNPTSPLTGAAQTGLTSPTYTLTSDAAPSQNGKQFAVTTIGGTQTGVAATSASAPFTITLFKPANFKQAKYDANGVALVALLNATKLITRKSVSVDSAGTKRVMLVTTTIDTPAGADTYAGSSCRAALSCHFGALADASSSIGDAVVTNVF